MGKAINYKEIEGIITPVELEMLVESRSMEATNMNKAFALFIFEINAVYSECLTEAYDLNKLVSKIIYKNIRRQDFFTIDSNGRFVILFNSFSPISIYMPISRILDKLRENLGDFVDISIGSAHCPLDGVNFTALLYTLIESLSTSKNGKALSSFKDISNVDIPEDVKKSYYEVEKNKSNHIKLNFLINQINKFSNNLKLHTARVTKGSISLAQELNLGWSDIEKIAIASLLHDIGYTIIPPAFWQKGQKHDKESMRILRLHPTLACDKILKPIGLFARYIPLIEDHHEFLDGSGFPQSKKGHQIEIGAQVISIVDMYCSLVIENTGIKEYEFDDMIDIYTKNAGIKWNKDIVTCFTSMLADPKIRIKTMGS